MVATPSQSEPGDAPGRAQTPRLSRRKMVVGAAGALTVAATARHGVDRPGAWAARQGEATPEATPAPEFPVPVFSEAEVEAVIAALAEAGVAVYDGAEAAEPVLPVPASGPLSLLRGQVRAMVLEATNRSGVVGTELDALTYDPAAIETGRHAAETTDADASLSSILDPTNILPDPQSVVTPSLLLTAYLAAADSPGAALARRFVPVPAADQAAEADYPGLILTLFSAELARESAQSAGLEPGALPNASRAPALAVPPTAQGGICSAAQGFIDSTLNALFNALRIDFGSSTPGQILGGVLDWLLAKGKAAVQAVIRELTAPVMDLIKTIAGVLGTASVVVSAIRPWSLKLTPNPAATRLAVGSEPPIPGVVPCAVDLGGLDEWPADVADCAAQSGVPLPPLKPAGAACTWTIEQSRPLPLIVVTGRPAALDQNGAARLDYVTMVEDAETARGNPVTGLVRVTLTVARPEIADLQRTVSNFLFAQLPAIVAQFVRPILGPTVDGLLGKLAALTDSRATTTIPVLYHEPKKEELTPEPEPDGVPGTVSVVITTIQESVFTFLVEIEAGTCDGVDWAGDLHFVAQIADPDLASLDLDQTLPFDWSFAGGDIATADVGPFEAEIAYLLSAPRDKYIVTFHVTIEQTRGPDDQPAALTFTMDHTITLAGLTRTNPLTDGANLGVPIPIVPGNNEC